MLARDKNVICYTVARLLLGCGDGLVIIIDLQ